jgi:hypothetical protein
MVTIIYSISPYGINWSVFITEPECVYCAVRAECLNKIKIKFHLQKNNESTVLQYEEYRR